jgi:1,4-alpha-glucan branching enzyme
MAKKPSKKTTKQLAPESAASTPVKAPQLELKELPAQPQTLKPASVENLKPATAPKVNVTFALPQPGARQVLLSGEFNGWSREATPMKRQENGRWETSVDLAPGRYQYKFVVDGQWISDPQARDNVWNEHGTLNSVIEVCA